MSVMVGCQIKNASYWLKRYIHEIEKQTINPLRIVCMYGESIDATLSILKHWSRNTVHNVEIYQEPYLPTDERFGYALARLKREFQSLFKDEDYFFLCDPDIVEMPENLIEKLIADDKPVVAPMVWIEGRITPTFYDTYGYRKDKSMFHPFLTPGIDETEPFKVDSVGSCYLATSEAFKKGVYTNPFPHMQFCFSLASQGLNTYVDPKQYIFHVDLERYGIKHYPPNIPLSFVNFLTNDGRAVSIEQVNREHAYEAVREYEFWFRKNYPLQHLSVQQFDKSRPLITASYKVLNEAEYLPYSLESIYPYVDRIDIVEGAVKKHMHSANSDGSSTDDTVEIIKAFPDPNEKIRLMQGRWKTKEHMQQKLLELCESRWMMFIDGDELYLKSDLHRVRNFCETHLDGSIVYAVQYRTLNFWHDFKHIAYSLNKLSAWGKNNSAHPFLIWRDVLGLNFSYFHTYPMDGVGRNIALNPLYEKNRAVLNNVLLYHYGSAKHKENIQAKLEYFRKRGTGEVKESVEKDMWFTGVMPSDFVIKNFNGMPPEPLLKHPRYGKALIKVTGKKPVYTFKRLKK